MAYEIYIERRDGNGQFVAIATEEWIDAVASTDGVRLMQGDADIANPKTGEIITVKTDNGDAELFYEADNAWRPTFRWSERGRANFKPAADFDNPDSRQRRIAIELARKLEASLIGDEGQLYA